MSKVYHQLMAECREAQAKAHALEAAAARICPHDGAHERTRRELFYLDLAASARSGAQCYRTAAETLV